MLFLSNFLLALSETNKSPQDANIPKSPIVKKKREECLYPNPASSPAFSTKNPEIIGKNAKAILYIICIIPNAVPVTFLFTTNGIAGKIQLA